MILVVGEAFVNLRARQIGEATGGQSVDGLAVLQQPHHVMHADARAFDDGFSAAYSGQADQITIGGGWHGAQDGIAGADGKLRLQ